METVTPVEVVVKAGEMTTTGPVMFAFITTDDASKKFFFVKKRHEGWLVEVLQALDSFDAAKRKVNVTFGSGSAFGGFRPITDLQSV